MSKRSPTREICMGSKLSKKRAGKSTRYDRIEGKDWLPPVIEVGDERYRLKPLTPLYWEDYV
jgi:hypothetical protein